MPPPSSSSEPVEPVGAGGLFDGVLRRGDVPLVKVLTADDVVGAHIDRDELAGLLDPAASVAAAAALVDRAAARRDDAATSPALRAGQGAFESGGSV